MRPLRSTLTLLTAAIVVAACGAGAAIAGHAAPGVALVALSVAIACTALRHYLRSETRR